jgi:sulfoxide reductase catalytic subunit YedY
MAPLKDNSVTDEKTYHNRRAFIKQSLRLGVGLSFALKAPWSLAEGVEGGDFDLISQSKYGGDLELHSYKEITNYNNFYEFGTGKRDPAKNAHTLKPKPWHISVSGECENKGEFDLEDFIAPYQLEERIYRLRCVEGWSMVIPWVGVPLAAVLKTFKPTSKAKYVVFKTLLDSEQMPGQKRPILDWPYLEGLTIGEAMNPLSILSVGLYGKVLPNQNGAPIRLIVPWKYGFKSIKSIVSIHFQANQPLNTWQAQAPSEYGFYANVNPDVDHPRWSQASERVIGRGGFFSPEKRQTELFNGYQEEVSYLYDGLDLARNF